MSPVSDKRGELGGQQPWLIVVSGWTGAGKSSIADLIAAELDAAVASFDWLMSGLRALPEVWAQVELPVERQRRVGWQLLSRVAEQQLCCGRSCVLDLVARKEPRKGWQQLAEQYDASFGVIECICSDIDIHRSRVEGRQRGIPGWYELTWEQVERSRLNYRFLDGPKLQIDAVRSIDDNFHDVKQYFFEQTV